MTKQPAKNARGAQNPQITDNQAKIIYHLHRERGLEVSETFTLAEEPQFADRDLALAFVNLISEGHIGVRVIDASDNAGYWLTQSALEAYDAWAAAGRILHARPIPHNHRCRLIPAQPADSEAKAILRDIHTMITLHHRHHRQSNKAFIAELDGLLNQILKTN